MYVSVLERGLGGLLGVDGGWLPLPTHLQRYCDPASLVGVQVRPGKLFTDPEYLCFMTNILDFTAV